MFADEYCRACCYPSAFNLHTTVSIHILVCVSFMDLIVTEHEGTYGKLMVNVFNLHTLLRLYVALSGKIDPLD